MASQTQTEHFLLGWLFLLPLLVAGQRAPGREGKYIERLKPRVTDHRKGELPNNWLPPKEKDGFNILFDALKRWRPASSKNYVKVSLGRLGLLTPLGIHYLSVE